MNQTQCEDDDQLEIIIEPPKGPKYEGLKQLPDHSFNIIEIEDQFSIYMTLSITYLKNLIRERNKGLPQYIRPSVTQSCMYYKQIICNTIKGNFQIHNSYNSGITLQFHLQTNISFEHRWLRVIYQLKNQQWKYTGASIDFMQDPYGLRGKYYRVNISQMKLRQYLDNSAILFFDATFRKKEQQNDDKFVGIQNMGNTCYLNSVLQIIYFFRPIRKKIMQQKNPKKLTQSLQQLFSEMTMKSSSCVDAQKVFRCFNDYSEYQVRQQQDIHEFMIRLFEDLERQLPQIKQYWEGKGQYIMQSKDKRYHSVQQDVFNVLDLHLENSNQKFNTIKQSLESLLVQQIVQQLINTQFGDLQVIKKRTFHQLPDLLFMNIKRYSYNSERKTLQKIFSSLKFSDQINLSTLLGTPTHQIDDFNYKLYAVIVHKGKTIQTGHYYCYINTSQTLHRNQWYKFNDSKVTKVTLQKVKEQNSKKYKQYYLNKQQKRWQQRQYMNDETPYLLVYIRVPIFQQYQQVQCKVPNKYLERQIKKRQDFEQMNIENIRVYAFQQNSSPVFDPFEVQQYIQVPLNKNVSLIKQLSQNLVNVLGLKIGTVWKVNIQRKTIKYCGKKYGSAKELTVHRQISQKKGHLKPDYVLILSQQLSLNQIGDLQNSNQVVIIQVNIKEKVNDDSSQNNQFNQITSQKYYVIDRNNFEDFLNSLEKKTGKTAIKPQNHKLFQLKWNDFCVINLI